MDELSFRRKIQAQRDAEAAGKVADSMDVRLSLVKRMHAGELTLDQMKSELNRIIRGAKKAGKITRNQAFIRG